MTDSKKSSLFVGSGGAEIKVGQVWEHERTGLRMRIVQVPGGRKKVHKFVYANKTVGGNGRRDRGQHTLRSATVLHRRYRLVEDDR